MASVIRIAAVLGAVYVALCALLYVFQERLIFFPQPGRVAPFDGMNEVEIATSDGEKLIAWYAEAQKGCPTVLLFHGNASRLDGDHWRYKRLMDRGVGVVALAWRGYSGSTGKPNERGLHFDALAGYEWATGKMGISASSLIIHGISIGTGPAVKLSADRTVGALILEAPYVSVRKLASQQVWMFPVGLLLRNTFRSDLWIGDVKAPILVAHGTSDTVIPFSHGERLFEMAPEPKQFARFEGSQHNTLVFDGLYETAIWSFLDQNTLLQNCELNSQAEAEQ